MPRSDDDEIVFNASVLAQRYAKRVWWADRDELQQEGLRAGLEAKRTYDSRVGVTFGAYAWRAAEIAIKNALLRESSPVSGRHRPNNLRGLHRSPIDEELPANDEGPHKALERKELIDRVRIAVNESLAPEAAAFAWAILTRQHTSGAISEYHRVEPTVVYRATAEVRRVLRHSEELKLAWDEWNPT